jgi:hypothetical protein
MKGKWITWLAEELEWIEERKDWPRAILHAGFCARFGRKDVSEDAFWNLCLRKGWRTGRTGQFVKGQEPPNKGKTMPYNENSAKTQFKKGGRPHTWRGAGHERINSRDGYVIMFVAETNPWTGASTRPVLKHRYLWEQVNGPLPEGYCLKCLDGDKTNTDPTNWECIPRAMLPRLNGRLGRGYDEASAELKPVILATAKLEHRAREVKKGKRA